MTDGARAESLAADFLVSKGYKILECNYRTRWSELDIIAEKNKTIHFVEVKYRKSPFYGSGYDYVTQNKQLRLIRAAEMYMANRSELFQIDVVSITGKEIEYLENAVSGR